MHLRRLIKIGWFNWRGMPMMIAPKRDPVLLPVEDIFHGGGFESDQKVRRTRFGRGGVCGAVVATTTTSTCVCGESREKKAAVGPTQKNGEKNSYSRISTY
jgi:hypothetical protein